MQGGTVYSDFDDFAQGNLRSPVGLERQVLTQIKNDLQPSHTRTFLMLLLVQAIAGALTLLVCPQFGLGFNYGLLHLALTHVKQHLGSEVCTLLCSIIFITPGVILATLALPQPITANIRVWHCIGVAMLLLLPLAVIADTSLAAMLVWLLGSVVVSVPYVYVKDWQAGRV